MRDIRNKWFWFSAGPDFYRLEGYCIHFAWRPRPEDTPEGEEIVCAFGFDLWYCRRKNIAWGNDVDSSNWTGRNWTNHFQVFRWA